MDRLIGKFVGVNYNHGAGGLNVRRICTERGIPADRLATSPRIHLRDALFKTRYFPSMDITMGWVQGTVDSLENAPFGEGTLIRFRPSSRDDFHCAVTGEAYGGARAVLINDTKIHAFGLERL